MDDMLHDAKQAQKPRRRSRPKCYQTIDMFTGEVAGPPKRGERNTVRERDAALIHVFAAKYAEGCTRDELIASAAGAGLSTGGAEVSLGKLKKLGMISIDPRRTTHLRLTEVAWLWIRKENEADEPRRIQPAASKPPAPDPDQADAFSEAA